MAISILINIVISVAIYLVSHKSIKKFGTIVWMSLLLGLIISTIYSLLTDELFNSISLHNNDARINVAANLLGGNFLGTLLSFYIIATIDKKIYGKGPRE